MKNLVVPALLWLLAFVPAIAQINPEVRTVGTFHALQVSNGIEVNLMAGSTQLVEASADTPEQLARLKTEVRDGVLKISFDRKQDENWGKRNYIRNLRVNVTAAPLTSLSASSGAKVEVKGAYAANEFKLELSSGATFTAATFTAPALQASVSSGGVATLGGKIPRLDVQASSGAVFKSKELQVATCQASASSGGNIAVDVQESLTAEASSGGGVRYTGAPRIMKHTSSGGSVSSR
ncbi:head GIN domain-containing protein [Hymenobacter terrenus]|uniref:head GIN domain-containing protein n=1 Tax=Hymenobacter terrenus TaxID=1629124 RepID=UPI0006962B5F|nr:head GIN domain-containing protein [Hymenobacter terrenus]